MSSCCCVTFGSVSFDQNALVSVIFVLVFTGLWNRKTVIYISMLVLCYIYILSARAQWKACTFVYEFRLGLAYFISWHSARCSVSLWENKCLNIEVRKCFQHTHTWRQIQIHTAHARTHVRITIQTPVHTHTHTHTHTHLVVIILQQFSRFIVHVLVYINNSEVIH